MKSRFFVVFFLFFAFNESKSQTVSDLFNNSSVKIVWLGIDYSHARFIGDFTQFAEAGSTGPSTLKSKYFPAWNGLVLSEPKKYDIAGMFRKENVLYKINAITKINASAPIRDMMDAENDPDYSKQDIQKFINKYSFEEKQGIGILFVAESLNKHRERGKYHVVAINLSNKNILLHDVLEGKAGGFGLRNYWAKSISEIITQIRDIKFRAWKREYGG
jgi:hypothetical protein